MVYIVIESFWDEMTMVVVVSMSELVAGGSKHRGPGPGEVLASTCSIRE